MNYHQQMFSSISSEAARQMKERKNFSVIVRPSGAKISLRFAGDSAMN
jgi:hypothetical protein